MGYVAKSDGRVSEAEIDAARRADAGAESGRRATSARQSPAFRTGKSAGYDANLSVERLREACGLRYDLLRAFVELQLRAALAGNGISPPARGDPDADCRAARDCRSSNLRTWRHRCARGRTRVAQRPAE